MSTPMRMITGFIAAVISVLIFHQGMWALLHVLDMAGYQMPAPYPMRAIPPWNVPAIVNLCFWGGLYGAVFGLLAPRFTLPLWLCGLITGLIAVLVGFFLVPAIKGLPMGGGYAMNNWIRSILINGTFGIGIGIIYPILANLMPTRQRA